MLPQSRVLRNIAGCQLTGNCRPPGVEYAAFLSTAPVELDMSDVNKVVLAYSGGLDTSVILKWLSETYHCEVVTFTADIGQGEEVEPARKKAQALGVSEIYIDDLREEFARDFVFPPRPVQKWDDSCIRERKAVN